jgi:hypothetical protein
LAKLVFRDCPASLYAIHLNDGTDFSNERETAMRLLAKLLVLAVICLVGIGFWQGWFSFSSSPSPDPDSHKASLNVSVDKDKMKSDVKKAKEMVKEEVGKIAGKGKPKEAK